jgi:hypothetical protein
MRFTKGQSCAGAAILVPFLGLCLYTSISLTLLYDHPHYSNTAVKIFMGFFWGIAGILLVAIITLLGYTAILLIRERFHSNVEVIGSDDNL